MDSTVKAWWESYLHDFFGSPDVWFRRYLRDFSVDAWFGDYLKDFFSPCREIDDWFAQYRRDFLPKRSAGSGRVEVVAEKHGVVLFSELVQVGRGEVTNPAKCGKFLGYYTCLHHEKHEGGVVEAHVCFNYCCRPSCPRCFYYGWCVRNGRDVEARMLEAERMFGLRCEHIMVSLPVSDYNLSFEDVKEKVISVSGDRGVFGGYMLPHRNRVDEFGVEYFSGHFHILGFIKGGYSCRDCAFLRSELGTNVGCGNPDYCVGFEQLTRRLNLDDKYIVKVMGERKTLFGTAFYQGNHASLNPFKRRARVGTYFGKCGYNNLRADVVKPKAVCGLCGSLMGFADYKGSKHFVTDRTKQGFKKLLHESFFEDGKPVWEMKEFGVDRGND